MSKSSPAPAFQFYPDDWLSSARVTLLPLDYEGAYIRLLCYCWREGSLPNDPDRLVALVGKGATRPMMAVLSKLFSVDRNDNTKLIHSRLDLERKKQRLYREQKRKAGKTGAKARWRKDNGQMTLALRSHDSANAIAMAKNSSPSPSSSPPPGISTHTHRKRGADLSRGGGGLPSSEAEAVQSAVENGVPPDFARSLYHQCEGRGWVDGAGHKIQIWSSYAKQRYLNQPKDKAKADRAPREKTPSIFALKAQKEAKEELARQLRNRYCSDVAMGDTWSDPEQKKKHKILEREINELTERMAKCH